MGWISAVGGIASSIIGSRSASKAAKSANQGFSYLAGNPMVANAQANGLAAGTNIGALLGLGTGPNAAANQAAAENAFGRYQDSTGYQFRLGQGMEAITGSAAARGLLNSGSTAKGLTEYGQNFASAEFNNYLQSLANVQSTGLNSAYNVASQGTSAGSSAGTFQRAGAGDVVSGLGTALGGLSDIYAQQKRQ